MHVSATAGPSPGLLGVPVGVAPRRRRHVLAGVGVDIVGSGATLLAGARAVPLLQPAALAALPQVRQDLRQLVDDDVVGGEGGGRLRERRRS